MEFVLLGLSQTQEIQLFLFVLFFVFYSVILPANIIILTIWGDPHLGSPMYFFLANLAFLDICYCSIIPPPQRCWLTSSPTIKPSPMGAEKRRSSSSTSWGQLRSSCSWAWPLSGDPSKGTIKVASTCVSHVIIIFIMFSLAIYIYCQPFRSFPLDKSPSQKGILQHPLLGGHCLAGAPLACPISPPPTYPSWQLRSRLPLELGNILIFLTVWGHPHLGSPMYFLLANLAFMDICYCSVTPPMLPCQSPSEISVSPGQTVALECAVANVTADKVNVNWIRQSPGQKPEGVLLFKTDLSIYRALGIPERYVPSRDASNKKFLLTIHDVQEGDDSIYFCFAYYGSAGVQTWGEGTRVRVLRSSLPQPQIQLFPPAQEEIATSFATLTCLVSGFFPGYIDVLWRRDCQTKAQGVRTGLVALGEDKTYSFYLLGTVLAPLRVALAFIVLFLIWPFALLQVLHRSEEELKEPLMDWRSSVSYSSVYLLSRLMFFLLGFMQIRVRGQRASRLEAPILVAAPHSTFFDPIILLPCDIPMVVSRTENLHVPVIGALLRFNQAILVSRHDPASRKKVVEEVKRRATSQGKWPQLLFFPEGTCSNKKALLKFKPGAFIAGVPIQPILVRYPNSLDSTTWAWQGPGVLKVIWLTASQLCTTVEVEFLPVYQPSAEESINPTLYASNVQRAMARALGIPATECELVGTLPVRAVGHLRGALEPRLWELDRALRRARWVTGGPLPDGGAGPLGCQELARWLGLPHPEAPEGLCAYFQQLFCERGAGQGPPRLPREGFCAILRLLLGTPWADGAKLYTALGGAEPHHGLSIGQFQDFALCHPDYAPLFSTYLCLPVPARRAHAPHANGLSPAKSKAD
ncbi:Lysophospholipid acyltransferase LPCAT4 [Chelonia mydas]|uniref:Lysophospholipid acyltransferase LPCAT4 n=1 Tax=Chelonia mydas TaxID=8469 RepID=M7B2T9_CHEMY|nr:Lysophospholipid acyltransferase LPCAT4 [Chelonia mydas]